MLWFPLCLHHPPLIYAAHFFFSSFLLYVFFLIFKNQLKNLVSRGAQLKQSQAIEYAWAENIIFMLWLRIKFINIVFRQ